MGECSKILSRQKNTRRSLSPTLSGKLQGAGWGCGAGGHPPRSPRAARSHARPSPKPAAAPEAVGFRKGSEPDCHGGSDFRPGVTLLSASNAATGRSRRGFSDCAGPTEASEGRVWGTSGLVHRLSALRIPHSPEGLQPEPGPAHRARPQPAPQPRVRAAWPVLVLGFVVLSRPGTSPETRATRACGPHGKTGFIRSREFCPLLWSNSETPLIIASRRTPYCQGPACTAVYGVSNKPNLFKRSLRATQAKAGSSEFRPPLPPFRYRGYHVLSP